MPKQIRHWMGLVWKKCPVSNIQDRMKIRIKFFKIFMHLILLICNKSWSKDFDIAYLVQSFSSRTLQICFTVNYTFFLCQINPLVQSTTFFCKVGANNVLGWVRAQLAWAENFLPNSARQFFLVSPALSLYHWFF